MREDQPHFVRRRRTVRKVYWGRIVAVVTLLAVAAIGIVLWLSRKDASLSVSARTYWLVSVGEYEDEAAARTKAQAVMAAGGAGYLYGTPARVLTESCPTESRAEEMSARWTSAGERVTVLSLECPAVTVSVRRKNTDVWREILSYAMRVYDDLYDLLGRVERSEISVAAAQYAVSGMRETCERLAEESAASKDAIGFAYEALYTALSDALRPTERTEDFAAASEYALIEAACLWSEVAKK